MDLRRLTCFLAVADELNFSRAAQRLHMSQPPLSQQIRLLEQEMGAQLFERSRRAVALTPAGLLLQDKARQIVELHQQAGELVRMAAHGLAGRLRIAFTASVPLFDEFSTMLRDFRSCHPQVELDLQHMTTGEQIAALTARSEERDELQGFELGVDEYISKPFSPKILVARVNAILRRTLGNTAGDVIEAGDIKIDKAAHIVKINDKMIDLSYKEFELLSYFVENQGIALSREKILNNVWNYDYFGDARTIDTHVKKLRSKLGDRGEYIKTIWGMG